MQHRFFLWSLLFVVGTAATEAAQIRYAIVVHSEQPGGGGSSGVPVTPNFNATSPAAKATYVQWREAILSFAALCAARNLPWQFQTDLNFAEGVARYEVAGGAAYDAAIANGTYTYNTTTGEKSTNTDGVNVVKYLHDHYGVNLDPHSHESSSIVPYNYADVAYQIDVKLNTDITGVVGGHVYDPASNGYQDWPKFIEDRDGNGVKDGLACLKFAAVAPGYRWKPVLLMGAGSLAHSADLHLSGLWRPQDASHFTTPSTGDIAAIGNWEQDLHDQHRFLRLIEAGTLPDDVTKLWTLGRVFNHRDFVQTGYLNGTAVALLDTIKHWRDAGRFQVQTLQATYDEWTREPFNETSSLYQRPADNLSFSLNWQDFAYPDKSIAELGALLNHHEAQRVPVDVFLTTWQTDLIESLAPDLLGRLQSSAWVSMAYHVRPPKPYASDYDWFTSTYGRSMSAADIQTYEEHGLDLTSGEPTGSSGGFAKLTNLMGYAPRVVGAGSSGTVAAIVHQYFAGAGAAMLVEHSNNAINFGEMLDGMYLRPESYDWKLIETYRGDSGSVWTIDEALARAHASTGNQTPWFVGVKLHDNDLFSEQSAWSYVYLPLTLPRTSWNPSAKPAELSETTRSSRRSFYLSLVTDAASRRSSMNVVNVRDTLSLLGEAEPRPIGLSFTEVDEAQPAGTILAEINGGGVESGVECQYSLVSGTGAEDNAAFSLNGPYLIAARALDCEATPALHFRLRWTDSGGNSGERAMTLVLRNVTTDDDDGDGFTEAQEVLAGTDPRDAASHFAATSVRLAAGQVTVEWASVTGKQYRLQWSNDLTSWFDITGTLVTATTASTSLTLAPSGSEREFYRVAIVP